MKGSPWKRMELVEQSNGGELWQNDQYTVIKCVHPSTDPEKPPLISLSIRRNDRQACRDWRDFQRIKNDILGEEAEAFELFPKESHLVDSSNQYWLWHLPGVAFTDSGIGFAERLVADSAEYHPKTAKAVQRPWHPADRPSDCRQITSDEIDYYLAAMGEE